MITQPMRHLIDWQSISGIVWRAAVERTLYYGERAGEWTNAAHGRSIALMFFNPSLRTRTSMELAAAQLGASSSVLTPGQGTWDFEFEPEAVMDGPKAEHIREAVGVLSRYYDALGVRLFASLKNFKQDRDERLMRMITAASSVPVINLESAFYHPCQALADAATIHRHLDDLRRRKFVLAWTFHPRPLPMAVPNSALLMAARLGDERRRGPARRVCTRLRNHGICPVLRHPRRRDQRSGRGVRRCGYRLCQVLGRTARVFRSGT